MSDLSIGDMKKPEMYKSWSEFYTFSENSYTLKPLIFKHLAHDVYFSKIWLFTLNA